MKTCRICRAAKPLEEFHKRTASPDGKPKIARRAARYLAAEPPTISDPSKLF